MYDVKWGTPRTGAQGQIIKILCRVFYIIINGSRKWYVRKNKNKKKQYQRMLEIVLNILYGGVYYTGTTSR